MEEDVLIYDPTDPQSTSGSYAPLEEGPTTHAKSGSIIARLFETEQMLERAITHIEALEEQVKSLANIMGAHL